MKRVGFLLPDFEEGGMPKVASNIMAGISSECEGNLILLNSESQIKYYNRFKIERVIPKGNSKFQKFLVFIKRIKIVKEIKKKNNYDMVISFGVAANIINILTKQKENTLCTEHNIKSIENKTWGISGKIYDFLIKSFYSKSDYLVAISHVMKEDLKNHYKIRKNIDVIYNPHNINEIIELSNESLTEQENEIFKDKITLINVGRLTFAKGQNHLIKVISELKKEFANIQLLILGEGELENELRKLAKEHNVEDSIVFLGYHSNPYKFIRNANLFVMSSIFEGFPNVLIESLACETPIISTDCKSGPREIIDEKKEINKTVETYEIHKCGILVPSFEKKSVRENAEVQMVKGITKLLSDPILYKQMKNYCLLKARNYDLNKIVSKYEEKF